jgi:hypothetical protein
MQSISVIQNHSYLHFETVSIHTGFNSEAEGDLFVTNKKARDADPQQSRTTARKGKRRTPKGEESIYIRQSLQIDSTSVSRI